MCSPYRRKKQILNPENTLLSIMNHNIFGEIFNLEEQKSLQYAVASRQWTADGTLPTADCGLPTY